MSLTLTGLVSTLRDSLYDATPPPLWSDQSLQECVLEAVSAHSYMYPRLVYTLYDVANAQQDFTLAPVAPGGSIQNPPPTSSAEMIAVVGVECPPGTPIPEDPWRSLEPSPASSSRAPQGYRWRWHALRLRVPANGAQVGSSKLVVALAQTWDIPDNSNPWNGPASDVSLLLLLAKRKAYQLLAEWQAREQGVGIVGAGVLPASSSPAHIPIETILAALEVDLARAITLRAARNGTFPLLPPSP